MAKEYFYVTQYDENNKTHKLLGFNLTEKEKDKLFYSLGKNKNSSCPAPFDETDKGLCNSYGGHNKKFKNQEQAVKELITKPDEFNKALSLIEKYGFVIAEKNNVAKNLRVVSYQMYFNI